MPLCLFDKLGLGEMKPTIVKLTLVDRSYIYPTGEIENVLVNVDKFIFIIDFIIIDVEEDKEALLIIEPPFLVTGRTLIDVIAGELIMIVINDVVFKAM